MNEQEWLPIREAAKTFWRIDKRTVMIRNGQEAYRELGFPDSLLTVGERYVEELEKHRKRLRRSLGKMLRGTDLEPWVSAHRNVGESSIALGTGLMPFPPEQIHSPGAANKCAGLHVVNGEAPKRKRGEFKAMGDPELKAVWLERVAAPAIRVQERSTYYRTVYDDRRERTLETHPPMLDDDDRLTNPDCEGCREAIRRTEEHRDEHDYRRDRQAPSMDCGNVRSNTEGSHWTAGHRHRDALRVTAKAILRGWWRASNGMKAGKQREQDHAA